MTMSENTSSSFEVKEFLVRALGQLGVGAVLAVLLMLYYQSETRRWDERAKTDEKRWEQLFLQYQAGTTDALKTIEACCHDRLLRLEEIEVDRRRRTREPQ